MASRAETPAAPAQPVGYAPPAAWCRVRVPTGIASTDAAGEPRQPAGPTR